MRILVLLQSILAVLPVAGGAQTISLDPQTGDYLLVYEDFNGETHSVVVEAADKVVPWLAVSIDDTADTFLYHYQLGNGSAAASAINLVTIPCPADDPALIALTPHTWNGIVVSGDDFAYCRFLFRARGATVQPGSELAGLALLSEWLPAIVKTRAFGVRKTARLPSLVAETPDSVYRLIASVQGYGFLDGAGREFLAVAPNRPPETMADPGAALDEIAADLNQACDLDWVGRPPGVCNSLQVKLDAAASSLASGDTTSATGQLQAFVSELDAQRGQHVSENAYWLLKVNVEYVLGKLQP